MTIAILFAFVLGAFCSAVGVAIPAPPTFSGVLLILAVTAGYRAGEWWKDRDAIQDTTRSVHEGR